MMRRFSPILLSTLTFTLIAWTGLRGQPKISDEDRLYKLALSYEASGDLPGAARTYQELLKSDPDSRNYFEGLKRVWLQLGRFDALAPVVAERLVRFGNDVDLLILHAELLHRSGKGGEADNAWKSALSVGAKDVDSYIKVGQSQMGLRLFDKAVAVYEQARQRFGRNSLIADRLGRLYAILGDYKKSANEYLDMLSEGSGRLSYVQSGLSLITDTPAGVEAAIEVTQHLVEVRKGRTEYLELLSWLYSEKGDDSSAFEVVKRLDRERNGRGSEIYAFADKMLRVGKYGEAIRAYEYFLKEFDKDHPLTPSVVYSYVFALQQRYSEEGNLSKVAATELINQYREVLEYGKSGSIGEGARLAIAQLQADVLNQPEEGLKVLESDPFDQRSTNSLEALLLRADLTLRTADILEARQLYRQATEHQGNSYEAERLRDVARLKYAETLLFSGDYTEAVDSLTVLTNDVGSNAANDALDWLILLQEHLKKDEASVKHFVDGRYQMRRRVWKEAIISAEAAVAESRDESLADDALFMKVVALRNLERYGEAVETALQIVEEYSDGTHADQALFLAAEISEINMADTERAMQLYTRVLVEYPISQRATEARDRIRMLRGEGM